MSYLDQVIRLVLSAFRLEPILTWRYTQGGKSLGLLVLSDLEGEALISTTLSIQMWSRTFLLFPEQKARYHVLLVCCCCGWSFTPLGFKESHYFGIVQFKFYGVKEKIISICLLKFSL